MAAVDPVVIAIQENAKKIAPILGIDPAIATNEKVAKFYKMIDGLSTPPTNTIRIMCDLIHDIGGLVNENAGNGQNVINYLKGQNKNNKNNNNSSSSETISDTFLTKAKDDSPIRNARSEAILSWLSTLVDGGDIQSYQYIPTSDENNVVKDFKKAIEGDCQTIILDAMFGNPIKNYFTFDIANTANTPTKWNFLYPTVGWTDAASKLTQKTVENVCKMSFIKDSTKFNLYKFFDSREHTFEVDGKGNAIVTSKVFDGNEILKAQNSGGFSVNGICKAIGFKLPRGKGNKDKVTAPKIITTPITSTTKLELLLIKTITDYSQVYYAALLYHILDYKTLFITNDRFCLYLTYLLKLPYVLFSVMPTKTDKRTEYCYIFDKAALNLSEEAKIGIKTKINEYRGLPEVNPIKEKVDSNINQIEIEYDSIFKNTINISNLLATDIILNDIDQFKKTIKVKEENLKNDDLTNDEILIKYSILRQKGISEYLFDDKYIKQSLKLKYDNLVKIIDDRIKVVVVSANNGSTIPEYIEFLLEKLSSTLYLYQKDNIIPFLLAFTFNKNQFNIQNLVKYYFQENNDIKIEQFRLIARYIFIYNIMNIVFKKLFTARFGKKYAPFIPLITLINNEYSDNIEGINIDGFIDLFKNVYDSSILEYKFSEGQSYKGLEFYCYKYYPDRFNFTSDYITQQINALIEKTNKAAITTAAAVRTAVPKERDVITKTAAVAAEAVAIANSIIVDGKVPELDTYSVNNLKELREKIFKIQFMNEGQRFGSTRKTVIYEKDYYLLMLLDYFITRKEVDTIIVKDYFNDSKILTIYKYARFKEGDAPIDDIKHYIALYEKKNKLDREIVGLIEPVDVMEQENEAVIPLAGQKRRREEREEGEEEEGEEAQPAIKRSRPIESVDTQFEQEGGSIEPKRFDVFNLINYVDIDTAISIDVPEFDLKSKITEYQEIYSVGEDVSKPSISYKYLNEQLTLFISKYNKIENSQKMLEFYNDMLAILKTLLGDAEESNEGDIYQNKLDILYLYFIQYDYDERITPIDLIKFMLNMIFNDDVVEKYFFNLIGVTHLSSLLTIFSNLVTIGQTAAIPTAIPTAIPIPMQLENENNGIRTPDPARVYKNLNYQKLSKRLSELDKKFNPHIERINKIIKRKLGTVLKKGVSDKKKRDLLNKYKGITKLNNMTNSNAKYKMNTMKKFLNNLEIAQKPRWRFGGGFKTTRKNHKKIKITRRNYKNAKTKKMVRKNLKRKTCKT